jgi:vancomycin permeability regulator SanA
MKYRWLLILPAAVMLWLAVHTTVVLADGFTERYPKAVAAVVLGNRVEPNGKPSERLKARLDRALYLYQRQEVSQVLVSGGLGKEGHEEAVVMARYLVTQGVPRASVLLDLEGNTTWDTAMNARALLKPDEPLIVVSSYFHLTRTKLAFQKAGFTRVYSSYSRYFELRDLWSLLREFGGFYAYWWRKA